MATTHHVAEVTDPLTGERAQLSAATVEELEHKIDEFLTARFPEPPDADGPAG